MRWGTNATQRDAPQPVLQLSFPATDGWALTSSPEITANWIAASNKWTVPVGGGVSKVIRIAELPMKLEIAAYYNAIGRPSAKSPGSRRPS